MKKFLSLFYIVVSLVLLAGCQGESTDHFGKVDNQTETSSDQSRKIKIATTIVPLYSVTSYLVDGTGNEVVNIIPPNTSEHNFQLTPALTRDLMNADLVVINGLHLEEFLDDVIEELGEKVVDTSILVDEHFHLDEEDHEDEHEDEDHHEDEDEEDEHGHDHDGVDPHIWLSPLYFRWQAEAILEALVEVDPENEDLYYSNFALFVAELDSLESEIASKLGALTPVPYIVFHNAYGYFEEHFGLESAAAVQEFPGKEPSVAYMAYLIDLIENHDVKVIFSEPQFSPKLVETLTEDYGIIALTLDPLGTELSKESYFKMMRSNLESFQQAFTLSKLR